ncbi:MAG: hypothetical protein B6I22_01120 [Desulfobacteraceae bacterium 4572_123]|nr:MAG: hypothetical protein B6I22_01120 [Desulfobacteraceae bacterium 4572_123]
MTLELDFSQFMYYHARKIKMEAAMKNAFILILLTCTLLIAPAVSAESVPAAERNLILTDGTAEVSGENDSVRILIAVVTHGRNLEATSAANMDAIEKVLSAVKSLDIKLLTLKTIDYRVTPQRDYKAKPPEIKGYEVHNSVAVTLEGFAPDRLSRHASIIISKALENGANSIQYIKFYIKNRTRLEHKALAGATRQAIARAEALAKAAGVKLKRIVTLSTHPEYASPMKSMLRGAPVQASAEAMLPVMEPGESRIRVKVNLAYEIE